MSGQLVYQYAPPLGLAGTLDDLSPYSIDSRLNGEAAPGNMLYGMGVMQGATPGVDILVPTAAATAEEFEGIAMNQMTTQQTMGGQVHVYPGGTVGVLRWGRAWARIPAGLAIQYEDPVFLIISGADAGKFTNVDGGAATLAIKATFTGKVGTGSVAVVDLRNQLNA